jgi:type II secretory pathway pseudopilin PulG
MRRQTFILFGALVAGLALTASWAHMRYTESRRSAERAAENLTACQELARSIRHLKRKPTIADNKELEVNKLTRRIQKAVRSAGASRSSIVQIDPQPARRLRDTAYKEKPTRLTLQELSMRELLDALDTLTEGASLRVERVRMSPPQRGLAHNWDAEVTVAYLIFEPESKQ